MSAVSLLLATRARIARPGCWTSGALARNLNGSVVPRGASTAVSWDLLGALLVESPKGGLVSALRLIKLASPRAGKIEFKIGPVNDALGQAGVLRLLDSAIRLARLESGFDEETPLFDDPALFI